MADDRGFQERVRQIGLRVQDLEGAGDPAVRAKAKELVQLLMEMHGSALERMLEVIFQSGETGARLINELGEDPEAGSLLILYGLHPDDLWTRVERKLAQVRPRLFKMGAEVKLIAVTGNDVRVSVHIEGHTCGSSAQNVKAALEEAVDEAAPDLTSLVIEGIQEASSSGFVAMNTLVGATTVVSAQGPIASSGAEGMD